ncbi:Hpt domain-containing protein [Pseudomonadota bacterium]
MKCSVDVIDFDKALSAMSGDRSLLNETLQDFVDYYADAGDKIGMAISERRYHDAEIVSHTLKGLGATFAAEELNRSAEAMETLLRDKAVDRLNDQLADLKEAIDQMVAVIQDNLKATNEI